jgi:hypothetical protein
MTRTLVAVMPEFHGDSMTGIPLLVSSARFDSLSSFNVWLCVFLLAHS